MWKKLNSVWEGKKDVPGKINQDLMVFPLSANAKCSLGLAIPNVPLEPKIHIRCNESDHREHHNHDVGETSKYAALRHFRIQHLSPLQRHIHHVTLGNAYVRDGR